MKACSPRYNYPIMIRMHYKLVITIICSERSIFHVNTLIRFPGGGQTIIDQLSGGILGIVGGDGLTSHYYALLVLTNKHNLHKGKDRARQIQRDGTCA